MRGEVAPGGLGGFLHLRGQCRLQVCEQFVWWVDHGGRRRVIEGRKRDNGGVIHGDGTERGKGLGY